MLFIGSDHAGFCMKEKLKIFLRAKKIRFQDCGADTLIPEDDYPLSAHAVANAVMSGKAHRGILLCGSGQGVCISANKVSGIRAALCWNNQSAILARTDDDANILCLPARLISERKAAEIATLFLKTPFSKLQRHKRRISLIEKT